MVQLRRGLRAEQIRTNLNAIRVEVSTAAESSGRNPDEIQVLAASKYVSREDLPVLSAAGITLVGENRAQDLTEKITAHGELFTWDFIGTLQSKHVRSIVPHVRLIHSLATDTALAALERHADKARPGLEVLIEVNLAADPTKAGIAPEQLPEFIARSPFPVAGLMTMPPLVGANSDLSRPWFSRLRELAAQYSLRELSMGTTQDFPIAVEEGATIVRIGTRLYA